MTESWTWPEERYDGPPGREEEVIPAYILKKYWPKGKIIDLQERAKKILEEKEQEAGAIGPGG